MDIKLKQGGEIRLENLEIQTVDGAIAYFRGNDAKILYRTISEAGIKGAEWTIPVKLESGSEVVFVLKNIISFLYSENPKL